MDETSTVAAIISEATPIVNEPVKVDARKRRAELIKQCKEKGLATFGSVSELEQRLEGKEVSPVAPEASSEAVDAIMTASAEWDSEFAPLRIRKRLRGLSCLRLA